MPNAPSDPAGQFDQFGPVFKVQEAQKLLDRYRCAFELGLGGGTAEVPSLAAGLLLYLAPESKMEFSSSLVTPRP